MSVEQLAIDTKIPRASIDALEEDRFAALPGPVFVKGFFRCCARSLSLDAEVVLALLHEHERAQRPPTPRGRGERHTPQLPGRSPASLPPSRGEVPRPAAPRTTPAAMHAVSGDGAIAATPQGSLFTFDSLTPLLARMMSGASNSRLLMWIAVSLMIAVIVVTAFVMAGGHGPSLPQS